MRVECDVEEVERDGYRGPVAGVEVTCVRCGHQTSAYGTSGASVRACLVMLREECPRGEANFYTADGDE